MQAANLEGVRPGVECLSSAEGNSQRGLPVEGHQLSIVSVVGIKDFKPEGDSGCYSPRHTTAVNVPDSFFLSDLLF